MTAVLDEADVAGDAPVTREVVTEPLASWLSRAGASAVDVLAPLGVVATAALVALSATPAGWLCWLSLAAGGVMILLMGINRLILPTTIGWSLGRALVGIRVLRRDGSAVGPWRLLARDLAHLLDTLSLCVGWLWPLWDSRNRTLADLLLRTEVRRVEPRPAKIRRLTGAVLTTAAVVALVLAGLGYLAVYRHDHAVDRARAQISGQGPKMVAEMLTYNAGTLNADFAHAQSLTTDGYRPQLVAQQDAVKKRAPTTNEYWAANSAVLSASPDRASMLVMLQGQRLASQQQQQFISATVRVTFEMSRAGQWRVAAMDVLTKPYPRGNEAPK